MSRSGLAKRRDAEWKRMRKRRHPARSWKEGSFVAPPDTGQLIQSPWTCFKGAAGSHAKRTPITLPKFKFMD